MSPGGNIRVKLADFGFSREDHSLKTHVETPLYNAPKIREGIWQWNHGCQAGRYSPAVDIWSLGVVAAECLHNLPFSTAGGLEWCKGIVKHILTTASRLGDPGLYRFLLSHMVVIDPSRRASAHQCHVHVVSLLSMGDNAAAAPSGWAGQTSSPRSSRPFPQSDEGRPRYGVKRLPAALHPTNGSSSPLRGHRGVKRLPAGLRPATILQTIESDDGAATATATAANPSAFFLDPSAGSGTPSRTEGRRQHPSRAAPYPPRTYHQRFGPQQSSASSTATITPWRITQSTMRAARTALASGNRRRQHISVVLCVAGSRCRGGGEGDQEEDEGDDEEDDSRPSPSEPERAESSYLAAGYVLDPLWFGSKLVSEVRQMMGREEEEVMLSSVVTTARTASGMQSAEQAPQRDRGQSSVVVLTDDWVYMPVKDVGNAGWWMRISEEGLA
jgi:hypothetical protein